MVVLWAVIKWEDRRIPDHRFVPEKPLRIARED
jgi:hypothetical protein